MLFPTTTFSCLPSIGLVLLNLGVFRYYLQSPAIPAGPAWAVALALIFAGLALLLKGAVPVIRAIRRTPDVMGSRSSDDRTLDRSQLKEEIITSGLVLQTHSMLERWVETGAEMKELLQKMTDSLVAAQRHAELHTGLLDMAIKNQGAMEIAMAKIGERMQHMPTTIDLHEGFKENRHDARNMLSRLGLKEDLP